MLDHAREALELTDSRPRSDLDSNRMLQLALLSLIGMVGEAASRAPREAQAAHPGIAWSDAVSMRNRVIHGYDTVDWDIVWKTVRQDFPPLIAALERALADGD